MKLKIHRNQWYRIIDYYQNIINEKFLYQPLTPVTQHFIKLALDNAVKNMKLQESHPAWHVPIYPKFDLQTQTVSIQATDPDSIELI